MSLLKTVIRIRKLAIEIVIIFILFATADINRVKKLWPDPLIICYGVLFILSIANIYFWRIATARDLELAQTWLLDKYIPIRGKFSDSVLILANAISLLFFLYAARNPLLYSSILLPYSIVGYLADSYARRIFVKALKNTKDDPASSMNLAEGETKNKIKILEIIISYYKNRDFLLLNGLTLGLKISAILFALFWHLHGDSILGVISYIYIILSILIGELIFGLWRSKRDSEIEVLEKNISEKRKSTKAEEINV
jgi:hypothetical protein